jgi:pantetheine-phosphate adenylyltransferase
MRTLAVYPGSFDPPTLGHLNLLDQGLALFDRIVVAVARNSGKAPLFSPEERLALLREALAGYDPARVEADSFEGLLVRYARGRGAAAILRGLRGPADFEYELQMAQANRQLEPAVQSVFLMTDCRWSYVSSTIVREAAAYGADVGGLVPPAVARALEAKFRRVQTCKP